MGFNIEMVYNRNYALPLSHCRLQHAWNTEHRCSDLSSDAEFQAESFGDIRIVVQLKLRFLEPSEATHVGRQKFDLFWRPCDVTGHRKRSTRVFLRSDWCGLLNGVWIVSIRMLVPEIQVRVKFCLHGRLWKVESCRKYLDAWNCEEKLRYNSIIPMLELRPRRITLLYHLAVKARKIFRRLSRPRADHLRRHLHTRN